MVQKHCPKKSKKRIDKKNCPIVQGSDVLSYAYKKAYKLPIAHRLIFLIDDHFSSYDILFRRKVYPQQHNR